MDSAAGTCAVELLVSLPEAGTKLVLLSNDDRVEIAAPEAGRLRVPAVLKVRRNDTINPGSIIWSVTWRGSRFAVPLKSVEQIMGSKEFTMDYDCLGTLTDALT